MKVPTLSVIIPLYNGKDTILKTLRSLCSQPKLYDEVIIIDDASKDGSLQLSEKFLHDKRIQHRVICHKKQRGLAASYNEGIRACKSDLVVTLHQDIILRKGALYKIIAPFLKKDGENIVASYHVVTHPYSEWKKYNFWQKCYFARFVGKSEFVVGGKFNCFRRAALIKVGLYDEKKYKTAGEDSDMIFKLKRIGRLVKTRARIIHLHKIDPNFNWRDIVYKHAQYAQARGALFRNGRVETVKDFAEAFYREIIVFGLFVPFLSPLSLVLIVIHAYLYTALVYKKELKDLRILLIPGLNTILLFVSTLYSINGFLTGKEKI